MGSNSKNKVAQPIKQPLLAVNTYPLSGDEQFSAPKVKVKKPRVWELDFLRGLAILLVVFDHTMFDAGYMFGYGWLKSGNEFLRSFALLGREYWYGDLRDFWKPVFLFIFFFVSGICTAFSRNNFFRALKITAAAVFVSVVTYVLEFVFEMSGTFILFGVIQCFAVIILTYALFELALYKPFAKYKWTKHAFSAFCIAVGIVIIVLDAVYNIEIGEFTRGAFVETNGGLAGLFVFAEPTSPFITADYFPLLPFMGYFFLGAGLSTYLYPHKKSLLPFLDGKWHYPFTIPGRFSLIIYLAWQVVAIFVLALLSYALIGDFIFI